MNISSVLLDACVEDWTRMLLKVKFILDNESNLLHDVLGQHSSCLAADRNSSLPVVMNLRHSSVSDTGATTDQV